MAREKHFVIQDAAMNDLIRPTLYDAYHEIIPVAEPSTGETMMADVVGPVCESGDYLAKVADAAAAGAGRSSGHHDGRRLWRRAVRHLQHATAGAGSSG